MWSRGREQAVKRQQVIPAFVQEAVKRLSNQTPVIPLTTLTLLADSVFCLTFSSGSS